MNIVLITHYYPPINSSGAKRVESLSKYFTALGHNVSVLTTSKNRSDGEFTESIPKGVTLIELDWLGRYQPSVEEDGAFEPMYTGNPSLKRRIKNHIMNWLGQIPDPRLPLSVSFLSPWFSENAKRAINESDIVIGTTPPWPMVLSAIICKFRFKRTCILDYRDQFSECHEMPGSRFAKWLEKVIDRWLVGSADYIVCISEPMSRYYRSMASNVETILNGYDHELLDQARERRSFKSDGIIRIRYMGIVSPGRVPHNLLQALVILRAEQPELFNRLNFEFYGNAALIRENLDLNYPTISSAFFFFSPIPYLESLQKIVEADYLLFSETSSKSTLSAQGILTTKLFEYVGSGRPILADISADTLAGTLLLKCGNQHYVGSSANYFLLALKNPNFYKRIDDIISPISDSLSRRSQAVQYDKLIKKIVLQKH